MEKKKKKKEKGADNNNTKTKHERKILKYHGDISEIVKIAFRA